MKKTFLLPIFISFFSLTFSFHLEEYKLFTEAKILSENGQYEKASFKFQTLEKTLPNSFLVKNNYHHFFSSLNFYKMKDLNKAIFQMEKAVYIPQYLNGKNLFSKDRDFYLATFYSELGNSNSSYESNSLNLLLRSSHGSDKKFSSETLKEFMTIPSLEITDVLVKEFLDKLSVKEVTPVKSEKVRKIEALEKFKNPDFLVLELENGDFPIFFISDTYAKNNLYHLAFLNSKKNRIEFGNSKNLISYLYPKYYSDLVEDFSNKFGFPPEILYTLLLLSNEFKEVNIQLKSEKLAKIYKNNQNNPLPTMVEYLYGEEVKKTIVFENGDTYLFRISDTTLRENVLSILKTYTFYKNIY